MDPDAKELKVVIVGQTNVGKTCIVRQATAGVFSEDSAPTLGASYLSMVKNVNDVNYRLQIWDTAGQERYKGMTPMYYRGANVALVVYSVTDAMSFDAIDSWLDSLRENAEKSTIIFLVGNKADCETERAVSTEKGQSKAKLIDAHFYEVSAKTGQGIGDLFDDIPKYFVEKEQKDAVESVEIVDIKKNKNKGKGGCC